MLKPRVRGFLQVAPIVSICRTVTAKSGQNAEMLLYGFVSGVLGSDAGLDRYRTQPVPATTNGSWTGSWLPVAKGLSYQCRAKVEGWL